MSASPGPIALYGATGFTGRLIAEELQLRGLATVLAGRNHDKLTALAATLPNRPEIAAIECEDAVGLRALFADCSVVIGCAGPFGLYGGAVAAAAAAIGAHYLDTTGEQPFIRQVVEQVGPAATKNGVAAVSGMGFDYAPGDMLASLTAADLGPLDSITLAYGVLDFDPSRGTMLSALEMMAGGDLEYRAGQLVAADPKVNRGSWDFPAPTGSQRMTRYPAGEQITVPLHIDTREVRTLLSASATLPRQLAPLAPLLMAGAQGAMRTPLRRLATRFVERLPEGPSPNSRQAARFVIECRAAASNGQTRRGILQGSDIYGTTARLIGQAAAEMTTPQYAAIGGIAPAQAFAPAAFLDSLHESISYRIDQASPR